MQCLPIAKLPEGSNWEYEVKFDGYRALAIKSGGRVRLMSRNQNDLAARFPILTRALANLPDETVIDSQNRNWWFTGIVVQRQVLPNLAPGLEIFHGTSQQAGQSAETGFNLGMVWDLSDVQHIMLSAGPAFGGPNQLQGYFAYQLTFGP